MGATVVAAGVLWAGCLPDHEPPLRITEYQAIGVNAGGPWIEIFNDRRQDVELARLSVEVGGESFDFGRYGAEGLLESQQSYVLGTAGAEASGIPVDLLVDDFTFDPAADPLVLLVEGGVVDELPLSPDWPASMGASAMRDPSFLEAGEPLGWCEGWHPNASNDFGSPGEQNAQCDCVLEFEYLYLDANDSSVILSGTDQVRFLLDGTIQGATLGTWERWTDEAGQHLTWEFDNGVAYAAFREFGEDGFVDQPITVPPELGAARGVWNSEGCF